MTHTLDLRGHFAVPPDLQEAAEARGLHLESIGGGRYRVRAANDSAMHNLAPGFAAGAEVFDAEKLRRFLRFLHQPLESSTQTHEARVLVHRMLRFAATGSVQMPGDDANTPRHKHLEDDEHVDVENAIKAEDSWRTAREFNVVDWDGALPGALPRSGFDERSGLYYFYPEKQAGKKSPAQEELRQVFRDCISAATGGRVAETEEKISLTGTELENFCAYVESVAGKLQPLFLRAEYDEQVQNALANVQKRRQKSTLEAATKTPVSLESLLKITSELTPLVRSDAAQQAWKRYHFFERNDSPLPAMIMELGVLQAVLDASGPADASAIAEEFGALFAFSRRIFRYMEEAAQKKRIPVSSDFIIAANASQFFPRRIDNQKYRELSAVLRKGLGLDGAGKQLLSLWGSGVKAFGSDMFNFFREKPYVFVAATLVAVYLYHAGTGTSLSPEIREMLRNIPQNSVMIPGPEGLIPASFDVSTLPEWARAKQNWHLDGDMVRWVLGLMRGEINPIGTFKHYTFDIFVSDPAHALMNHIEHASQSLYAAVGATFDPAHQFATAAHKAVGETVDKLFGMNILQNATHAGWWMYLLGKGLHYGLRGGQRLVKLMAPAFDLACVAGVKTAETLHLKQKSRLTEKLMAGTIHDNGEIPAKKLLTATKHFLTNKWTLAAGGACAATTLLVCAGDPATAVATARSAAFTGSAVIFAIYNSYDDIFLNHFFGGATLLGTGAFMRFFNQKAVGPVARWVREGLQDKIKALGCRDASPISLNLFPSASF